jgi:hypothetical protein
MKITKRGVTNFTTVIIEGIEIGQIKLNADVQIISYDNGDDFDLELLDYDEITYMNMKVTNTNELFKFHTTLGIDLQREIYRAIEKALTDEVIKDLVKIPYKAY